MKFDDFYSSLEKIPFLDYEIDDTHNLDILSEFKFILTLAKEHNLQIGVTGSISCLFYTNKIYRSINDLDFIVEYKDIKKWLLLLKERYNYFKWLYDEKHSNENIQKKFFKKEHLQLTLENKLNKNLKIEFFVQNFKLYTQCLKFLERRFNEFNISYHIPLKFIKKEYFYNRQKDYDDISFYEKYFE